MLVWGLRLCPGLEEAPQGSRASSSHQEVDKKARTQYNDSTDSHWSTLARPTPALAYSLYTREDPEKGLLRILERTLYVGCLWPCSGRNARLHHSTFLTGVLGSKFKPSCLCSEHVRTEHLHGAAHTTSWKCDTFPTAILKKEELSMEWTPSCRLVGTKSSHRPALLRKSLYCLLTACWRGYGRPNTLS